MNIEPLPLGSRLEQYEKQAHDVLDASRTNDPDVADFVRGVAAGFDYLHGDGSSEPRVTEDEARAGVARWYHFESWASLENWLAEFAHADSLVAPFEHAVEAIVSGDIETLDRSLREYPSLIRVQSLRGHRATLLIYVGANGVEWYRQKTPRNAVAIAERLLDAGAEIDAIGKMYRGTTTLGLVATSVHPVVTGVQEPLMQLLLDRGASIARAVAPDYTDGLVVSACLANGRPGAAEFLARRGAELDIEGAAGVGDLAAVQRCLADDAPRGKPSEKQLQRAFGWACGYGRADVVEFLLTRGLSARGRESGETPLHHAAHGGHPDIVKLLLARGAEVNAIEESYEATPLGWAMYGYLHPSPEATEAKHHEVVEMLVGAGAGIEAEWLEDEKVRGDERMSAALRAPSKSVDSGTG
jgi:ankyrin repeat protein